MGSLANAVINFTDVAFVARLGETQLAASALGGLFYFVGVMIGFGFGTGIQILIARRNGEGQDKEINKVLQETEVELKVTGSKNQIKIKYKDLIEILENRMEKIDPVRARNTIEELLSTAQDT